MRESEVSLRRRERLPELTFRDEFEQHGLTNVRLQHRNVCKDGFGDVDNVESGE
jgi:hypothetical protein